MRVELLSHTINPEQIIATAAKLCYSSSEIKDLLEKQTPERIESFLKRVPSSHQSILEHASFTFAIEGVSRVTEVQLVRHRISSFSIQSGRYVKRNKVEFIEPPMIKKSYEAHKIYQDICAKSNEAYNNIVIALIWEQMHPNFYKEHGFSFTCKSMETDVLELLENDKETYKKFEKKAIEDARYAHLQSTPTRIICTMNLRSLKHFFNERCCARAQWEIREMANEMLKICKNEFPLLFKDAGPKCVITNSCPEGKMTCGKVFKEKIDDIEVPKYSESINRISFDDKEKDKPEVDIDNKNKEDDNLEELFSDKKINELREKIINTIADSYGMPREILKTTTVNTKGNSKCTIGESTLGIGECTNVSISKGCEESDNIKQLDIQINIDEMKNIIEKDYTIPNDKNISLGKVEPLKICVENRGYNEYRNSIGPKDVKPDIGELTKGYKK